jgi:aspartate kinase
MIKSIKFGGTSMGSAKAIMSSLNVIKKNYDEKNTVFVVVSAVSGMTGKLIELCNYIKKMDHKSIENILKDIKDTHCYIANEITGDKDLLREVVDIKIIPLIEELELITRATSITGEIFDKTKARICSFGERLSACLMCLAIRSFGLKSEVIMSDKIISTDKNYLDAHVDFEQTKIKARAFLEDSKGKFIPVITGFFGSDVDGNTTLLGRGSSDYTASIIGLCMNVDVIEIWTDVNGVMSADPRIVDNAKSWDVIDVDVMSDMAYGGAKVVHPKTVIPVVKKSIPIYILNTFNQDFKGTRIERDYESGVKGVVSMDDQVLINCYDLSVDDEVGFIANISNIVKNHNISIDICATSETSFSFSINKANYNDSLYDEISSFAKVSVLNDFAKVSVVGNNIVDDNKLLIKILNVANEADIGIKMLSIPPKSKSITMIVDSENRIKFVKLLHEKLGM